MFFISQKNLFMKFMSFVLFLFLIPFTLFSQVDGVVIDLNDVHPQASSDGVLVSVPKTRASNTDSQKETLVQTGEYVETIRNPSPCPNGCDDSIKIVHRSFLVQKECIPKFKNVPTESVLPRSVETSCTLPPKVKWVASKNCENIKGEFIVQIGTTKNQDYDLSKLPVPEGIKLELETYECVYRIQLFGIYSYCDALQLVNRLKTKYPDTWVRKFK